MNWERLAAETNDVFTPANFISVAGSVATLAGIEAFNNDQPAKSATLISFGRAADLLDGAVARATNTVSSKGEALDAVLDKLLMAKALPIMKRREILSNVEMLGMLAHHSLSSLGIIAAKIRQKQIHTSQLGKRSTALEWTGIGLGILANTKAISHNPAISEKMKLAQKAAIAAGIAVGSVAALNYCGEALK